MRELDELLLAYLELRYDEAPGDEKSAFEAILALPDPELLGYLLQHEPPPDRFDRVVARILDRSQRR